MNYSEKEYLELKKENQKFKSENQMLKVENRMKREYIKDLEEHNYKNENIVLKNQNMLLKNENEDLKKKLQIFAEKFEMSRISQEKNSSNSCKPSSTNGFKKVIQNNRVKSGMKPGRKKGYKSFLPKVATNPDEIIKVSKVATCSCGCKTQEKEEVARDVISIQIIKHTTQYVGKKSYCPCCHKEYMPKFPKNINNTINYDNNIKSLLVFLSTYCNVPNQKCVEFLGFLSDGKIKISSSTVLNTVAQFSKKSQPIIQNMKKELLKQSVINEDETPINVNGKIMSTIGVFTNKISVVEAFENRKLESFEAMGILDRYIGTICHDHNNIHKSFIQAKHAECNFHILRYCKAEFEIHKRQSILNFMNYMLELRDKVEAYKYQGKTAFTFEEYEETKKEYLNKLTNWDDEYSAAADKNKIEYYKSEKNLKARLREYVDDHLRFLRDFRIDFTNNLAERGLRKIKTKLKIAGCFRALKGAKAYCDAISIIDTCKKQNIDIHYAIENIFNNKKKIFEY